MICRLSFVKHGFFDDVHYYESWVVPAGVPSALADIGGAVEANY